MSLRASSCISVRRPIYMRDAYSHERHQQDYYFLEFTTVTCYKSFREYRLLEMQAGNIR